MYWALWNPIIWDVEVLSIKLQSSHLKIKNSGGLIIFTTIVYCKNDVETRKEVWRDLIDYSGAFSGEKWIVLGDFNEVLLATERHGQNIPDDQGPRHFLQAITDAGLNEPEYNGDFFTWCNGRVGNNFRASRIDRALVSDQFKTVWPALTVKLIHGSSDHLGQLISLQPRTVCKKPFRIGVRFPGPYPDGRVRGRFFYPK